MGDRVRAKKRFLQENSSNGYFHIQMFYNNCK